MGAILKSEKTYMSTTKRSSGRPAGPAYGYSDISGKPITMAELKRLNRRAGGSFFDPHPFGRERFYGPYVGPGGVFFVTYNDNGCKVRRLMPDYLIRTMKWTGRTVDDAQRSAKAYASGQAQFDLASGIGGERRADYGW